MPPLVISRNQASSKRISDDSDQLEKSGLSEEHEEPQNQLGYLSDGSHNSKKRKIDDDSNLSVESFIKATPVAGNPLRIRLIFNKQKPGRSSLPREDLPGSTSGAELLTHREPEPVVLSSVSCSKVTEPEENLPSTSAAAVSETKKRKKHKLSREDQYNALFDDWTSQVDSSSKEDDDWLFGNRTQEEKLNVKATVKNDGDMNMCLHRLSDDSSCPKAQFLPKVGIYSLPYTVPF